MESRRQSPPWRYVAIIAVALSMLTVPAGASDVDSLIKSLKKRRSEVKSLHTVTTNDVRGKEGVRHTEFEYWEVKTGKSRKMRRIGKSKITGGEVMESVTVSDGQYEWSQLPGGGGKTIVKSAASSQDDLGQVTDALKRGKARTRPGEKILGFETVVVEVVGDARGASYKASYWISEKHGVILKSSIRQADGNGVETETTKCEVNGSLSDEIFTYSPPAGAQVIDTTTIGRHGSKSGGP